MSAPWLMYREIPKSQSFTSQSGNSPVRTRFWGWNRQRNDQNQKTKKNHQQQKEKTFHLRKKERKNWENFSRIRALQRAFKGDKRARSFLSSFRVIACSSPLRPWKRRATIIFYPGGTEASLSIKRTTRSSARVTPIYERRFIFHLADVLQRG